MKYSCSSGVDLPKFDHDIHHVGAGYDAFSSLPTYETCMTTNSPAGDNINDVMIW